MGGRTRADIGLPILMVALHVWAVPLLAMIEEDPISGRERLFGLGAYALCSFILVWRRAAPELVLAAIVLIILPLSFWLPDVTLEGIVPPEVIALFSVAAHRGPRTAGYAVVAATLAPLPSYWDESWREFVFVVVISVAVNVLVVACGQARRWRRTRSEEITARLAGIEAERRAAAAAERERLARDLHDVAGHHLSAVVVHASAAARLAERQPELAGESLELAATTGKEVIESLSRLVDVVGEPVQQGATLTESLTRLAEGLTRLGMPVSLSFEGRCPHLPVQVSDAVYRIVQESLTNAVRYGGGGAISALLVSSDERLEVTVRNTLNGQVMAGLGSGRGLDGMQDRAMALGGSLTAGPRKGEWRVEARIPLGDAEASGWSWNRIIDLHAAVVCAALAMMIAATATQEDLPISPSARLFLCVLLGVHCLPVALRRRAPWGALAGLLAFCAIWCVMTLAGLIPIGAIWLWIFAWQAEAVAVYGIAVYSRRRRTWAAPLVTGLAGIMLGLTIALIDPHTQQDPLLPRLIFFFVAGWLVVVVLMAPFWLWGHLVRRRRDRVREWERQVLAAVTARTDEARRSERHQIALGLRGDVLGHSARMVEAAERPDGDLSEVVKEGRAALAGMRKLLDVLDEAPK